MKTQIKQNISLSEIVQFYLLNGIITFDDVLTLSEEALMNKLLRQIHPYKVYYSERDDRWHTYIKDDTLLSGSY